MTAKKAMKVCSGLISICICSPIWYYVLYSLLKAANVDRLVWFLFWIYIPTAFFASIVQIIADKVLEDSK